MKQVIQLVLIMLVDTDGLPSLSLIYLFLSYQQWTRSFLITL